MKADLNSSLSQGNILHRALAQVARHEVWLLVLVGPLMLFPTGPLPWVGLGIAALAPLARWATYRRLSVRTPLDLPILILALMAGVGSAISIDPELSGPRFWSLLLGMVVYYALVNWASDAQRWAQSFLLLALLTLGVTCLSLFGVDWSQRRLFSLPWLYDSIPNLLYGLPGSGAGGDSDLFNPRWVGITMGFLAPVFLGVLFFSRERVLRLLSALTALAAISMLLLTQSLQGLVGLAVGVLLILVWRWRWALVLIPISVVALAVSALLPGLSRTASFLLSSSNPVGIAVALRLDIWSRALSMLHDMPYTGIGLNTFPLIQANFYPGYQIGMEPHAHNLYLQTALDLGVPGLLALLWLLGAWFVTTWRKLCISATLDHRLILIGMAAGLASYLAHGWIDALMLGAKPGVALWMMLALGVSAPYPLSAQMVSRQQRSSLGLPVLILVGVMLSLAFFPAALLRNWGAANAHRLLYQGAQGELPAPEQLVRSENLLAQALQRDVDDADLLELYAQIESLSGRQAQAVEALARRVQLDSVAPLERYFPPGVILRWAGDEAFPVRPPADDLLSIYTNWVTRYPQQATHYVRTSLLLLGSGNPDAARHTLEQGLTASAQPADLLAYALAQITVASP